MKKLIALTITSVIAVSLVGCTDMGGPFSNQGVGTVTGGVVGGFLGNQIGHGGGRALATIGGTLVGAAVGSSIGKSMDINDRMQMDRALETAPTGQPMAWTNPDAGTRYSVTPVKTYSDPNNGMPCREYTTKAMIGGKWTTAYGTACRNADGSWKIVN